MSFWKKLLGRDFDTLVQRGEQRFDEGNFGEARLDFEQALAVASDVDRKKIEAIKEKVGQARDRLAEQHLEDGKAYSAEGELERALELYETAGEIAHSDELRAEAHKLAGQVEADDARAAFEEADEMTDDERFIALSGAWEDDQADELESYGEEFKEAFLALHKGEAEKSAAKMKALLDDVEDALYLYLEVGLAQQAAGQLDEATATITTFLERLQEEIDAFEEEHEDDDEEDEQVSPPGEAAKIRAHTELARISLDRDDPEAAEAELRTLVELLPDQSAPYVELGRFLRLRKRLDEALEVLGKGQKFMGELRPDMSVPREIGLTQMELGNDAAAITSLKAVVDYSVAFGNFNFDPTVALPLATLYERNDQPDEAAHLFRHLAAGTYAAGHFTYNLEAGRLLIETKELDLARKYLSRAKELASGDDDTAKVEELMGKAG